MEYYYYYSNTHQQPSVIEVCELFFKIKHQHQKDTTHDNRTVLDEQRRLGHWNQTQINSVPPYFCNSVLM